MNTVSKDFTEVLSGETSLGLVFKTNLFRARVPDAPDICVTLIDMPGVPAITLRQETSGYYFNELVIKVRDNDYQDAMDMAQSIMEFLHAYGGFTLNGTVYTLIKALTTPQLLEWDENERPVVLLMFEVQRKAS